jgi:hypothetical protein
MPKARDRSEERADCLDERGLALYRLCVAQPQAKIVGHERRQRRDVFRFEGSEDRADVVSGIQEVGRFCSAHVDGFDVKIDGPG